MRHLFPLAAVFLLTPALVAGQTVKPELRTISTSGTATVWAVPDEVILTFGVSVEDADLEKATKAVSDRTDSLLRGVRRLDIPDDQIQTANLNILPITDSNNRKAGVIAYRVSRTYTVTLKNVPQFDRLVKAVLTSGANELQGFEFRSSKMRQLRDEARRLACRAAKEKADLMAQELGSKVGRPWSITEHSAAPWRELRLGNSNVHDQNGGPAYSGGELPSGQIPFSATVSVTFELE